MANARAKRTTTSNPRSPDGRRSRPPSVPFQDVRLPAGEPAACPLFCVERERTVVAQALRNETAQVLAAVLVGTESHTRLDELLNVRAGLCDLRQSVEADLERIDELAAPFESRVTQRPAPK